MWIYTDEETAMTGYFNETLDFLGQDVEAHIDIVEQRILRVDNSCRACGGPLDLDNVRKHGLTQCEYCQDLNFIPVWLRAP